MNHHLFPSPPTGILASSFGRNVQAICRSGLLAIQRSIKSLPPPLMHPFQSHPIEGGGMPDISGMNGSRHIFQVMRRGKATWVRVDDGIATLHRMSATQFNRWISDVVRSGHHLTIRGLQ